MATVVNTGLVLFLISFPFASQYARDRIRGFGFVNPLIAAYIIGIVLGNTLLRGERFLPLLDTIATAGVLVSIPLMLFNLNLRTVGKTAGKALLGITLAGVSILVTVVIAWGLFGSKIPDFPGVAGLLVAVYTGGTPNLAAIRTATGIDNDLYLAVHAGDVFIGAIYVFFMITVARRLLGKFLKAPDPVSETADPGNSALEARRLEGEREITNQVAASESFPLITEVFRHNPVKPILGAIGLTVVIIGISAGASLLFPSDLQTMIVILLLTTLSIAASFVPRIREIRGSFELGEYAIHIFALAAGAMGDFSRVLQTSPWIFLIVGFAIFVSLIFHILLSRLFKLDVDIMMISSTAAICSPPFIGVVATAIGNRRVIAPGIAAGLLGYAMGNYLGIAVVQILRAIAG
jgi:uncharacterized membrane protein